MPNYKTLLADATQLSVPERIQLMDDIWATLPADYLPPLGDEWMSEIQRRSAAYDAGAAETIPWEQIKAEARLRAGLVVPDASH